MLTIENRRNYFNIKCDAKPASVIDRSKIAQALAKAIAFKQCGKHQEANDWARQLINLLECSDILAS